MPIFLFGQMVTGISA